MKVDVIMSREISMTQKDKYHTFHSNAEAEKFAFMEIEKKLIDTRYWEEYEGGRGKEREIARVEDLKCYQH